MIQLPSALLEPPAPAPAKQGKEPPGSPPDTPFSSVLDNQARTATAEGQQRSDKPRVPVAERDAHEPPAGHDGDDAATDTSAVNAAALAALLGGVPLPAGVAAMVVARLPADGVAGPANGGAAAGALTQATPFGALAADQPAAMPTGPAVPTAATALPLRPVAAAPVAAAAQTVASEPAVPAGDVPNGAVASATRLADVLQSATARPGAATASPATGPAAAAIPAAATVAGATGNGSTAGGTADGFGQALAQGAPPAPVPVLAAPAPAVPAFAPATPAAAAAARGVGLEQAVETVRLALRASADRGVSHARISLTPRELGGIEVHLRQTADGLVARVVAEHATAAQLLQHAGGELRRSARGAGAQPAAARHRRLRRAGRRRRPPRARERRLRPGRRDRRGGARADDPLAPLDGATATDPTTTLALPNGALVDVLA